MQRIARTLAIGALMTGVATAGLAAPAVAGDAKPHDSVSYLERKYDKCKEREYKHGVWFVKLDDKNDKREYKVLIVAGKHGHEIVKDKYEAHKHKALNEDKPYYLKHKKHLDRIKWSIACWDKEDKGGKKHDVSGKL